MYWLGSVGGSLLGGSWSDRVLIRLKAKNGGTGYPEASNSSLLDYIYD